MWRSRVAVQIGTKLLITALGKNLDFNSNVPGYELNTFTCDTCGIWRCWHIYQWQFQLNSYRKKICIGQGFSSLFIPPRRVISLAASCTVIILLYVLWSILMKQNKAGSIMVDFSIRRLRAMFMTFYSVHKVVRLLQPFASQHELIVALPPWLTAF